MSKLMIGGLVLAAVLTSVEISHAYVNYPWCIEGRGRGMDCVFASKEQCAEDGRNRGFGSQCMRNPAYNPRLPSVIDQTQRALQMDQQRRGGR